MANFLFCSLDAALIGDIAWQVSREGHDVRYYIEADSDQEIADGFVPKTDDWRGDLGWADVVVFDDIWVGGDIGTGELAQELRAEGHAVVGGTPNTDALEEDRGYAMEVLEDHGVNTIEHHVFEDFDAGIKHVQENPAPYVIKPLGEVQNVKRLLYVGNEDDGSDIVDVLRAYKKAWGHRMKGFQLQRKVEGVEIAVCGFFNGESFVEPINFNFEHKKLFPGNIGPSTGEMGTSMFWAGRNELFAETLGKVEGWLADEGYVGSIDINCIVNEDGIYPLEFTPRFGYPTITLQEESFESETGQFFLDLANGRDPELEVHRGYQVAVRVVLPPFPFDDQKTYDENSRNAAVVFGSDSREGIHIEDAKRVPVEGTDRATGERSESGAAVDGQWRVAGESGMPLVVTGKGDTMQGAREQAYGRVDDILIPNCYYRDDIGERWIEGDGDRLQAWGYLGPAV
ncbi:phosphoribosylamine--glycine ligase [Haloarcula hispanica N601]|uniref:phosphoribosylamine--glycine ligase n=3 Tax=Haloarcula hispanica TaxID=51589 RepID=V5TK49_HALHI|nr:MULTISPECIES: phosphoribosylamine--glycine ligase [Haloarcula]AEM56666.1 phosphoribosylamine-glycine ligase [Haloarcula hispanica ATCC 33960]AHB65468.1 phosphoribosylamine--glycine ligase [Haloarcula hispanica N601]KZX47768.1 phosphoribosylamine--glycine ligase [Haloarcula sp. K1]